jgi:hypothetical protein
VYFTVWREERWMPLLLGWSSWRRSSGCENLGTVRPRLGLSGQEDGWEPVSPAKLGAGTC